MGIGDKVNAFGRGMKSLGKKAWTGTKMGLKIAGGAAAGLALLGAGMGATYSGIAGRDPMGGALEGAKLPYQLATGFRDSKEPTMPKPLPKAFKTFKTGLGSTRDN